MEKSEDFFDFKLLFHQPILKIESYAEQAKTKIDSSFGSMETNSKDLLKMLNKYPYTSISFQIQIASFIYMTI